MPDRGSPNATTAAAGGPSSAAVGVADESHIGEARRRAEGLGVRAGLDDTERGTLAVIVTETATNLARHAQSGVVVMRTLGDAPSGGVEVLGLDKGPGIRDLSRALADGFSTGGTAGHGLGAIRRMAGEFDLFSIPDKGTALLARVWTRAGAAQQAARLGTEGAVCLPVAAEAACGDGWWLTRSPNRTLVVLVDGLGHGADAAMAADAALRFARMNASGSPARIIEAAHGGLHGTRGAALAIVEILPAERTVRFAGIGNVSGVIVSPEGTRSLASHNGTVGHMMHRVQEFTYPWSDDACLILHSDGIMTRWRLDAYPGLAARDPALIAGVLYRDFTRGRDDATVLAVRAMSARP